MSENMQLSLKKGISANARLHVFRALLQLYFEHFYNYIVLIKNKKVFFFI